MSKKSRSPKAAWGKMCASQSEWSHQGDKYSFLASAKLLWANRHKPAPLPKESQPALPSGL